MLGGGLRNGMASTVRKSALLSRAALWQMMPDSRQKSSLKAFTGTNLGGGGLGGGGLGGGGLGIGGVPSGSGGCRGKEGGAGLFVIGGTRFLRQISYTGEYASLHGEKPNAKAEHEGSVGRL